MAIWKLYLGYFTNFEIILWMFKCILACFCECSNVYWPVSVDVKLYIGLYYGHICNKYFSFVLYNLKRLYHSSIQSGSILYLNSLKLIMDCSKVKTGQVHFINIRSIRVIVCRNKMKQNTIVLNNKWRNCIITLYKFHELLLKMEATHYLA